MTLTLKCNNVLHPTSHRINRLSLSVASSRMGSERSAFAHTIPFSSNPVPYPSLYYFFSQPFFHNQSQRESPTTVHSLLPSLPRNRELYNGEPQTVPFLNPRSTLGLTTFNVCTFMQVVQQVLLARSLDVLAVDLCCRCEIRIGGASSLLKFAVSNLSTEYFLRTFMTMNLKLLVIMVLVQC